METIILNNEFYLYKSTGKKYVIFVHGMVETFEGYMKVKDYLVDNGINVVLFNHRGHGPNAKRLGHLDTFESYKMVSDVVEIEKHIKDNYETEEVIVVGHSMGSALVRAAMKNSTFDKVVLNGTPASLNGFTTNFLMFVYLFINNEKESRFFDKMVFGSFNNGIENPSSKNDWVCSNPEYMKMYNEDKYSGYIGTGSFYQEIIRIMAMAQEKDINATKVLITTGGEDPVSKKGKYTYEIEKKLSKQGCECEVIVYDKMRHFIYDEIDCMVCFEDLLKFINKE